MSPPKTGILFLNMGGPDGPDSVQPFLYNLFSDPDIIRLPFSSIFQKPLAAWISRTRTAEARHNYAQMGGGSPILPYTEAQAKALRAELFRRGYQAPEIYIAMRYWHPFTEGAVNRILQDGVRRLIVLPLYPHFSYTTTGSSLNELRRVLEARQATLELSVVPAYYNDPGYLAALADAMREALTDDCWSCPPGEVQVLFSAHSLPLKHVKRTGDPYPEQIDTTARRVMRDFFPDNPWDICYQSQVGRMRWLGPSVDGALHYFAGKKTDNVLIVPISFVSDHVETLVEIDRLYLPLAEALNIPHCHRAPALNTRPAFIRALADLVSGPLTRAGEEKAGFSPLFPALSQAQGGM
jgi:ferrochelatase